MRALIQMKVPVDAKGITLICARTTRNTTLPQTVKTHPRPWKMITYSHSTVRNLS